MDAFANYQKAIKLDLNFAKAYSGDARTSVDVWRFNNDDVLPAAAARRRAYEAAERALAKEPNNARAFSVLALIRMIECRHKDAVAYKAVSLNPNGSEVLSDLALVLNYADPHEELGKAMIIWAVEFADV